MDGCNCRPRGKVRSQPRTPRPAPLSRLRCNSGPRFGRDHPAVDRFAEPSADPSRIDPGARKGDRIEMKSKLKVDFEVEIEFLN